MVELQLKRLAKQWVVETGVMGAEEVAVEWTQTSTVSREFEVAVVVQASNRYAKN